ncbi:MAG: putative lipid II flippase FtsW [Eubacterium sp.]|nr:putative lipid II flippase FtsW [Eubacterium sp.]
MAENIRSSRLGDKVKTRVKDSTFDYSLLLVVVCLIVFGLLMIFSSSSYITQNSRRYGNDPLYFLKKQGLGIAMGIGLMLVTTALNYKFFLHKFKLRVVTIYYFITLIMQTMVLFVGMEVNGAKRWLSIGGLITVQPSEFTKIALILMLASFWQSKYKWPYERHKLLYVGFISGPPILLVALENVSTAIVLCVIVMGMCIIAAKKKSMWIGLTLLGATGVVVVLTKLATGFRGQRVKDWIAIGNGLKPSQSGFQILQGLYAVASGGLKGAGIGNGIQKLHNIPEPYNDMIFAVVCEELGIIGAAVVLFMFIILLWRIYNTAVTAPDMFSGLICAGVFIHIAVQVLMNVAVVTNSMPSTGVPLPFISYGGTSVSILMAEIGIVLGISRRRVFVE